MAKNFVIKWKGSNGQAFEGLVGELLKQMYPNYNFKHTEYSHDGGKDFYAMGENNTSDTIWVEAKNYTRHLELSKFSNTFIMADISQVNRIILFSMSPLTIGATTNIARYAAYHRKNISVYSGDDILWLVNKYADQFPIHTFIDNADDLLTELQHRPLQRGLDHITVRYEYYRTRQFNLAYRREEKNFLNETQIEQLPLQTVFAQEIQITNHDLLNARKITLDATEYECADYKVVSTDIGNANIVLQPASTVVLVVYLTVTNCRDSIIPPTIKFSDDVAVETAAVPITCCWLGEIPYIGSGAIELHNLMRDIRGGKRTPVIVSGKSGVGKTRFLQELSSCLFGSGFRIVSIDFQTEDQLSLRSVLRQLLHTIFFLDSDTQAIRIVKEFSSLNQTAYPLYKDFYSIIFDDQYDCTVHMSRISSLFRDLLIQTDTALVLDNMQSLDQDATDFFKDLSRSASEHLLVFCFNEDFLLPQKAATKFFRSLQGNGHCRKIRLKDFSKNDALLYLTECIDSSNVHNDWRNYFNEIISKFGTNPFILKQVVLYLKQENVIAFDAQVAYISDYSKMMTVLNELPPGITNILDYRYSVLCSSFPTFKKQFEQISWSVAFFNGLTPCLIHSFGFSLDIIQKLCAFGFLERNARNELVFCHQLIEKFFCQHEANTLGSTKPPQLSFLSEQEDFLHFAYSVIKRQSRTMYAVHEMLLRSYFGETESGQFTKALRTLEVKSPRDFMLSLIINTIVFEIDRGISIDPDIELSTAYSMCVTCQLRYDILTAAKLIRPWIEYEQITFKQKLSANTQLIAFFKHYVFLLPINEKFTFLDWLIEHVNEFALPETEKDRFYGWLHNRYSKNLCSVHRFDEAESHIVEALNNAVMRCDYESASEAEIEYGNIFAYFDSKKTAYHWRKCSEYIDKSHSQTAYFSIYKKAYGLWADIICHVHCHEDQLTRELQELRPKTFLYQQLLIDDICADVIILKYVRGEISANHLINLIPQLEHMRSESYLYHWQFALLFSFKLLTIIRLLSYKGLSDIVQGDQKADIILREMIGNGIFESNHLEFSKIVLQEILPLTNEYPTLDEMLRANLPLGAKNAYLNMKRDYPNGNAFQISTAIQDELHTVNILHFNYVF